MVKLRQVVEGPRVSILYWRPRKWGVQLVGWKLTSFSALCSCTLCFRVSLSWQGMCGFGVIVGLKDYMVQSIRWLLEQPAEGSLPAGWHKTPNLSRVLIGYFQSDTAFQEIKIYAIIDRYCAFPIPTIPRSTWQRVTNIRAETRACISIRPSSVLYWQSMDSTVMINEILPTNISPFQNTMK